jgi:hypothetical protein
VGEAQLVGCVLVFVQGERCGSHLAGDGHGMLRVSGDFGELRLVLLVVSLSVAQGYRSSRGWLDARCVGKLKSDKPIRILLIRHFVLLDVRIDSQSLLLAIHLQRLSFH